ncbi:uncharacterized protein HKW66_Vig0087270 [Vigna angularis]|uniref:Uncharacterized protein n=1 Tax=Phaseolus angularis TaxID=3914 RepID=A0A8T0KIE7_PHAAN|nr:uncharacterized protein HKW66_Vig0087270 [Vigna angularis]
MAGIYALSKTSSSSKMNQASIRESPISQLRDNPKMGISTWIVWNFEMMVGGADGATMGEEAEGEGGEDLVLVKTSPHPTRSPTITPVVHLRRRKTLRMFLARRQFHPPPQDPPPLPEARVRHKLKDLFVSSPPPPLNEDKTIFHQQQQQRKEEEEEENKDQPVELIPNRPEPLPPHRISLLGRSAAALRPVSSVFRYQLLRRAWRRKIPRPSPRRSHILAAASSSPPPRVLAASTVVDVVGEEEEKKRY